MNTSLWARRAGMLLLPAALLCTNPAQAQNATLEQQVAELRQMMSEKDRQIENLEKRVSELQQQVSRPRTEAENADALDRAIQEMGVLEPQRSSRDLLSMPVGGGNLRLIDISMNVMAALGASTERDESLEALQGGGHDPRKRGFTFQQAELSLFGAVDPYFTGEAHLIVFIDPFEGETVVELEEAFLTTTSLPWGLQLEAGHFFTEFGRINPQHPHQWDWLDQPVINTRMFGPDGLRQTGFRLGWLTPLPWFSEVHFGIQNANGETAASFLANDEFFEERPIGGLVFVEREVHSLRELLYLLRWVNTFNVNEQWSVSLGGSGLYGPNASGNDGRTWIYGGDLLVKWRPVDHQRGWPFFTWQTEVIGRDYRVDEENPGFAFVGDKLRDWGFYTQLLYGFRPNWAAGLRYEYATGRGDGYDAEADDILARAEDPFRDNRQRISPLLMWRPSEFSRVRLQYNYDKADHLEDDDAHSVWLGFEILFGAHAAHSY